MDLGAVLVLGLSYLLVAYVVWQIGGPFFLRRGELDAKMDAAPQTFSRDELDEEELREDIVSGKILPPFEKAPERG